MIHRMLTNVVANLAMNGVQPQHLVSANAKVDSIMCLIQIQAPPAALKYAQEPILLDVIHRIPINVHANLDFHGTLIHKPATPDARPVSTTYLTQPLDPPTALESALVLTSQDWIHLMQTNVLANLATNGSLHP